MGFETVTPRQRCDALTNQAMSWSFVGHKEPMRNECEVIMKYFKY